MEKVRKKPHMDMLLIGLAIACVIAIAVMIIVLSLPKTDDAPVAFVPPPFEVNAVTGVPEVAANRGYSELYQEGMAYRVGICGDVHVRGNEAEVYLTNSVENNVWLKLRVFGANGEILGETGLIKPGEYVKSVSLNTSLSHGDTIKLKIMGYESESYNSAGAIVLNPTITVKTLE